jgi:uncharacterized protein (DUF58 family)
MIAIPYLSAMVQSNNNVKDLKLRVLESPLVPAGSRVEVRVMLEQTGKDASRRVSVGVTGGSASDRKTIERISPGEAIEVRVPVGAFRRGIHALPDFVITSRYPLGLFHTWKKFRSGFSAWIHPAPSGGIPWRNNEWKNEDSCLEYREHRRANPGDSQARIDWKRYARDRNPLFRVYDVDRDRKILLRWEDIQHLPLEDALSQLARWMIDAESTGIDAEIDTPFTRGTLTSKSIKTHLKALAGHGGLG